MSTQSDLVKQRVEELRIQQRLEAEAKEEKRNQVEEAKELLRLQQENERNNAMIDCEAEAILFLETYTDTKIISEFTEDLGMELYITNIVLSIKEPYLNTETLKCIRSNQQYCILNNKDYEYRGSYCQYDYRHKAHCMFCCFKQLYLGCGGNYHPHGTRSINRSINCKDHIKIDQVKFKVNYIYKYIKNLLTPIDQERQTIQKEKKEKEEQQRRKSILAETNKNINAILKNTVSHTFTDLTVDEWELRNKKEFLTKSSNNIWAHRQCDADTTNMKPSYTGTSQSFSSYFEEGKVPFCTKCPLCNNPTKLNYLNQGRGDGWGGSYSQQSSEFTEVYCDTHYFYDSKKEKHYIANIKGVPIITIERPTIGAWHYSCWTPSKGSYNGTRWLEWDPTDPDGKKAEAEKKLKEAEDIQRQIIELQSKLLQLNT